MGDFDLSTFVANLAARLLGDRAAKENDDVEFVWRSKRLALGGPDRCAFVSITFQPPNRASIGALYLTDTGSCFHTAQPLTLQDIQTHFGGEVDVLGTKPEILARMMANVLRKDGIKCTSEDGIVLCYEGFCGDRPLLCKGAENETVSVATTRMILLGGRHPIPEGQTEDEISSVTNAIKSKWKEPVSCNASVMQEVEQQNPPKGEETSKGDASPTDIEAEPPAPQPDVPKKRKPNNVKSRVKKKKKRTGTLSFVD